MCSNLNRCYCEVGWSGADCSIQVEMALTPYATSAPAGGSPQSSSGSQLDMKMEKKETPYGKGASSPNPQRPLLFKTAIYICPILKRIYEYFQTSFEWI